MLNILLFCIIPILMGIWYIFDCYIDFVDVLLAIMIVILSFLLMLILVYAFTLPIQQEYILSKTIPIYALEDNNSIYGSFFLGSGGASNKMNYYYISDYKDSKKIYSISQNKAYIVESNEKPYIEVYKLQFKNKWLKRHLVNLHEKNEYKIVIPENSIKYNFNIDLK